MSALRRKILAAAVVAGAVLVACNPELEGSSSGHFVDPEVRHFRQGLSQGLVISQVYGGGGSAAATYTTDYVELFNRGSVAIDITGWAIQYAPATGPSAPGNWSPTTLQRARCSPVSPC
jgi:hypothetical protein